MTTEMPFINNTFEGLGTAPALESLELGDDVPVAINPDEISREATRYIWFAGNVITPTQKRERPDLRLGGEYFGQEMKCLVRSKGLVRRGQITPLEKGFDFMGDEQIGDNATNLQVVAQVQHADPTATLAPTKLSGVQVYPGDEIKGILRGNSNGTNKGFVELKKLAGVDYADFKASGIQDFIFPEWQKILAGVTELPVKLSALVSHLRERRSDTSDLDVREIIDNMLVSCDTYREWGTRYLKYSSMLVKVPAHQGFVHTYSDLAEMLFTELEIRREDMLADQATADAITRAGNVNDADTKALLKMLADNQTLLMQVMTGSAPKVELVPEKEDGTPEVFAGGHAETLSGNAMKLQADTEIHVGAGELKRDTAKCQVITAAGTQCQNDADETGRCKHPAHRV